MAVGSDEMVDLDFLQDWPGDRSPPRAGGTDFLERSQRAQKTDERAKSIKAGKQPNDHSGKLEARIKFAS